MSEEIVINHSNDHIAQHQKRGKIMVTIDWLLYVPFILTFALILLIFDIIQRLAILFGHKGHDKAIFGLNLSLFYSLKMLGTKITVNGTSHIAPGKPYIIISNHQSMFDIPIIYAVLWRLHPRFIAKKELARWIPSISFNVRHGHNLAIDRKDPRQSIKAIQGYAKLITDNNYCAVIFPEGTRARKGQLKDFHAAGPTAFLKHAPTANIIPVCINGSWKLNKHKPSPTLAFSQITINIGDVIERSSNTSVSDILGQAYKFVAKNLSEVE